MSENRITDDAYDKMAGVYLFKSGKYFHTPSCRAYWPIPGLPLFRQNSPPPSAPIPTPLTSQTAPAALPAGSCSAPEGLRTQGSRFSRSSGCF